MENINLQLCGIDMADKILKDFVLWGFVNSEAPDIRYVQRRISELSRYQISGIQNALSGMVKEVTYVKNNDYTQAIDRIHYVHTLLRKATNYLTKRISNPEELVDINTQIAELLGHWWKVNELKDLGLWDSHVEILQLSFCRYNNPIQKEVTEESIWLNLKSGKIHKNKTVYPYIMANRVKEGNTVWGVLSLKELYFWPGLINPKICWRDIHASERAVDINDIHRIHASACNDYLLIDTLSNCMIDALTDKNPVVLLALHKAYSYKGNVLIEDSKRVKILLKDSERFPFQTVAHLKNLLPENAEGFSLLVRFNFNSHTGCLSAQPLSLITPQKIIRLLF